MATVVMASPIGNGHLIDAGVTLAIVVLVQAAYCTLKWQARVASRFEWWRLFACASVFGTLALGFLSLGATSQRGGYYKLAYAMLICCKGTSVLSIWCFEVLDVLYLSKDGWLLHATAPFSNWGTLIFWTGLAIQCLFISLGLWSMASFRIEFLWATPLISHINVSAMAGYALGSTYSRKATLLQLWVVAGVAASITSLGFCIAATRTPVAGHAPVQCILCAGILSVKAYRDWQTAKGRANGREEFLQDEPRYALSSDTIWPSNRDPEAPSVNALHHFQRCGSGSDSEVGLTSHASAASSEVSLSSSTTVPSEAYRRYGVGRMHFLATTFSIFRMDQQMIECYRTIHAFHRQINGDRLMPEAVGRVSSILDVGSGTGDWAMDMVAAYPKIQVIGTDLSPIQTHSPYNVIFYVQDANHCDWGWQERFDYIHFRDVDGGIKDWGLTLNAAFACLKPEGFLSLSDLIFHQPPSNIAPGSIWDEWRRALEALKVATGLSFGLHESGRARNELENSGYKIVEEYTESFQLRQKSHMYDDYDLLQSIIEQMKGVLTRALEFQPTVVDRQCLINRLEEEVRHGLEIRVARIVAQKPASIQPVLNCGRNAAVDVEG